MSFEPNRNSSAPGVVVGIGVVLFGLFWIGMAARMGAPPFMLIFGVVFVVVALSKSVFAGRNLNSSTRISDLDLPEHHDPLGPLDETYGEGSGEYRITTAPESVEERLTDLESLKSKGLVTEEEYESQRTRILQEI
jgi:hypothetical protein